MTIAGPCTGVILAGGEARRYGGAPKGLERVGGRRVIDRVADALAIAADDLLLVANDPAAASWIPGLRVATDVRPGNGSLGGIHAALTHARRPVLVVAWDMPFVSAGLLTALRALGRDADVAVPESASTRGVEPLCAYYDPACLVAIERRLDAGDRRVVGFFDEVRVAKLHDADVRAFGDPAVLFMNVNSPDELALAERYAARIDATHGGDHRPEAPR
ncbi:MAG TPA: molybdenum cofactor guanylyltransferase [Gemmatimonadaceae bacterium]|nr:molybdenum cofactor guanylyltransferase [Gemmatimonadaceae bacterium]